MLCYLSDRADYNAGRGVEATETPLEAERKTFLGREDMLAFQLFSCSFACLGSSMSSKDRKTKQR